MWQTTVRQALTPYLPPPVVKLLHSHIDPQLAQWGLGEEGSVTLLSTVLAAWLVVSLLQFLWGVSSSSRSAIVEEEDSLQRRQRKRKPVDVDAMVLLCGPRQAGKTRLFYQLAYPHRKSQQQQVSTLTSLQANVRVVTNNNKIQYMDWPGHASASVSPETTFVEQDAALRQLWKQPLSKWRLVLVLDATQPVQEAAAVLYQLWSQVATSTSTSTTTKVPLVICCHKQDIPKAKNARRIRIQLRTELEKLVSVRQPTWFAMPPGGLELGDTFPYLTLHFVATSCEQAKTCQELQAFCETGQVPVDVAAATTG